MSPADSVWAATLEQFTNRVASASPTPGGGAVAAVTLAFGASLAMMCLEISKKSQDESHIQAPLHRVEEACRIAKKCADGDILAFDAYMAASHLPKVTAAERVLRDSARMTALLKAFEAPLRGAHAAISLAEAVIESKQLISDNLLSDWATALALIRAALASLLFNVAINLQTLAKAENNDALTHEYEGFLNRADEIVNEIGLVLDGVNEQLRVQL
jgi:formiminotetrahydrofolate cyclodeaminase